MIVFVGIEMGQEGPWTFKKNKNHDTGVPPDGGNRELGEVEAGRSGTALTAANTRPASSSKLHSASRRNSKVQETNAWRAVTPDP